VSLRLRASHTRLFLSVSLARRLVQGNPRVVLFELPSAERYLDAWRWEMHERHGVSVPPEDRESNDAILFGFLVAWFLQEIRSDQMMLPMVAHCHEWLAGVALPLLRARQGLDIATVFTTHATLLGRYLCAGSSDFYNSMRTVDAEAEARRLWILHRHLLERAAAHSAHVFTTVSRITAEEATHLLKREPDLVLPNGLQIERLPVLHEFQNLHKVYKDKIHHFVRAHFIGMNDELMDYDNTLYVFTGGRYEYQNKGFDMFLESLYELNARLKAEKINKTVVAFIITPSQTAGYNVETLARQSMARNIEDTCAQIQEGVGKRLLDSVMHGRVPTWEDLMLKEDEVTLKRRMLVMKSMLLPPPIVTHNMKDDASDPILNHLRRRQLFNRPDDRVKVVFHPEFVTSTSLFQIDYDQFVRGCHLGVFVSYYEPWGYTPAECVVRGVPAVTSNLTGFANFMEQQVPDCARRGVYVVDRRFKSPSESIEQLTTIMLNYCKLSQRHRVELRYARARECAHLRLFAHTRGALTGMRRSG
jgi:glycogen(starch) synthase